MFSGALISGALLTLEGLPLPGLANSWRQHILTNQSRAHILSYLSTTLRPPSLCPRVGSKPLETVSILQSPLKLFEPADHKPVYPAFPCFSCGKHNKGSWPLFPHPYAPSLPLKQNWYFSLWPRMVWHTYSSWGLNITAIFSMAFLSRSVGLTISE